MYSPNWNKLFLLPLQTSRAVLLNQDSVLEIMEDLKQIDFDKLAAQASIADPNLRKNQFGTVQKCNYIFALFHYKLD